MQLSGVSRSARQTDTYQTDRNTKLPLYNSTRFTTPFYRNTRPTNGIGFLMVMSRVNYAGVRQQRRAAPLQRSTSPSFFVPPSSLIPSSTHQRTSGRPRPRLRIRPTDRRQQRPHHGTPSLPSPADHPLPLRPLRPARSGRRSTGMR